MHGKGRLTYEDGHYFEGDWVKGKRHGRGVYVNLDNSKYEGTWENDKIHGHGVCMYPNGNRFEGQWQNGKIHGSGLGAASILILMTLNDVGALSLRWCDFRRTAHVKW